MTVKVKYQDTNSEVITMFFGDSYKTWQMQAEEFERIYPTLVRISVARSKQKWIGWGGLKWCSEEKFQFELNNEGMGLGRKPRQVSDFQFVIN